MVNPSKRLVLCTESCRGLKRLLSDVLRSNCRHCQIRESDGSSHGPVRAAVQAFYHICARVSDTCITFSKETFCTLPSLSASAFMALLLKVAHWLSFKM